MVNPEGNSNVVVIFINEQKVLNHNRNADAIGNTCLRQLLSDVSTDKHSLKINPEILNCEPVFYDVCCVGKLLNPTLNVFLERGVVPGEDKNSDSLNECNNIVYCDLYACQIGCKTAKSFKQKNSDLYKLFEDQFLRALISEKNEGKRKGVHLLRLKKKGSIVIKLINRNEIVTRGYGFFESSLKGLIRRNRDLKTLSETKKKKTI